MINIDISSRYYITMCGILKQLTTNMSNLQWTYLENAYKNA